MKCEYGCEQEAKFINKRGKNVCSLIQQRCPATRIRWHKTMELKRANGWIPAHRGKYKIVRGGKRQRLSDKEIFKIHDENSPRALLRSDFLKRELLRRGFVSSLNKCSSCKIEEWLDKPLLTDLHHKNGDDKDCRLENLEILCPNCHRYTDNYAIAKGNRRNENTFKK